MQVSSPRNKHPAIVFMVHHTTENRAKLNSAEHNRVAVISSEQYVKGFFSLSPSLDKYSNQTSVRLVGPPKAQIQVCFETINVLCGSVIAFEKKGGTQSFAMRGDLGFCYLRLDRNG